MDVAVLRCEQVAFSYGRGSPQVSIPTLAVDPGVHYVVGLNGSGKSTLLKLLSGVLRPQRGTVLYQGESIATSATYREFCRASGYLWQNFALSGGTAVLAYLQYRAWLHGVAPADTADASLAALASVGMTEHAARAVGKLSGGMQRRVGIAAETVHEPSVVLLDEPSSGLDFHARDLVFDALDSLVAAGATVVIVAHEPDEMNRYDATAHVMAGGHLRLSETFKAGQLTRTVLRELDAEAAR